MRKKHYILILALILISVLAFLFCKTDEKLKGTWIGEYSTNTDNSDFKVINAIPNLLTFKNKRCYSKGSKFTYGTKIRESNYMFFSDNIIFESGKYFNDYEQIEILKLENDSLVLKNQNTGSFLKIYRKLSDTLKHNQKIKLTGKKFFWKNKFFQDTIHFKNDSILISISNKNPKFSTLWERINYNGFDILFIDGDVPYLIKNQNGNSINLLTFHKEPLEHIMTEIE